MSKRGREHIGFQSPVDGTHDSANERASIAKLAPSAADEVVGQWLDDRLPIDIISAAKTRRFLVRNGFEHTEGPATSLSR